jgi:hypothetical protein
VVKIGRPKEHLNSRVVPHAEQLFAEFGVLIFGLAPQRKLSPQNQQCTSANIESDIHPGFGRHTDEISNLILNDCFQALGPNQ